MSEAEYERLTLPEIAALSERWDKEQQRWDYRAAIAAGFIMKSDKQSFSMEELFPSLVINKTEEDPQSGIEAFKALMGWKPK